MGSVKDIIDLPNEVNVLGAKVFKTSNRFSIFDLKEYIEDVIPLKDISLCMQAAFTFELLEFSGVKTHYLGLLDEDNKVVKINDLKKPSNRVKSTLLS